MQAQVLLDLVPQIFLSVMVVVVLVFFAWRHYVVRRQKGIPMSLLVLVSDSEKRIEGVMRILQRFAAATGTDVVLVDEDSRDETVTILQRLAADAPDVRVYFWKKDRPLSPLESGHFLCTAPTVICRRLRAETDIRALRRLVDSLTAFSERSGDERKDAAEIEVEEAEDAEVME